MEDTNNKKITVMALGGAGCRILREIAKDPLSAGLELLAVDTDQEDLAATGLPRENRYSQEPAGGTGSVAAVVRWMVSGQLLMNDLNWKKPFREVRCCWRSAAWAAEPVPAALRLRSVWLISRIFLLCFCSRCLLLWRDTAVRRLLKMLSARS